jgi:hypothetical protein
VGLEDFRYIPSNENPADALIRGLDPERLKDWLTGPSFLTLPEAEWLHSKNQSKSEIDAAETKRELKPQKKRPKDKKVYVNPTVKANTTAETDNPENHSQEKTTESKAEENPILDTFTNEMFFVLKSSTDSSLCQSVRSERKAEKTNRSNNSRRTGKG